jgi:hypothetical protein
MSEMIPKKVCAQTCPRYYVQVLEGKHSLVIDLAPSLEFRMNGENMRACDWFLDVTNGTFPGQVVHT